MQTNFLLGAVVMTEHARLELKRLPYDLIARHAINDHGLITKAERRTNEMSMLVVGPIRSRFKADPTSSRSKYVLIDTDATWGQTLIHIE